MSMFVRIRDGRTAYLQHFQIPLQTLSEVHATVRACKMGAGGVGGGEQMREMQFARGAAACGGLCFVASQTVQERGAVRNASTSVA